MPEMKTYSYYSWNVPFSDDDPRPIFPRSDPNKYESMVAVQFDSAEDAIAWRDDEIEMYIDEDDDEVAYIRSWALCHTTTSPIPEADREAGSTLFTALITALIETDTKAEAEALMVNATKGLLNAPITLHDAVVTEGDWRLLIGQSNNEFFDAAAAEDLAAEVEAASTD